MPKEDDFLIKEKLSTLYYNLKANYRKSIIQIEENFDLEENDSKNLSIIYLIDCISAYVNCLIETKDLNNDDINNEDENKEKPLYKQYEELLIKAEDDIRRHIRVEQQLKIKIEDLEFELDDYRTGKIKNSTKNLKNDKEKGYTSYNNKKQKSKFKGYDNYKTNNNINKNIEKPISVNSNNNYIISKLKKENENLRLKLSKLESDSNNNVIINEDKYKLIENKILHKKLNDGIKITKNIINNKNYISKNNYYSFSNNTFTNNFYSIKENKNRINNNNSTINELNLKLKNYNKIIFNHNTASANSFVAHPKKINKNGLIKSFSIFNTETNYKNKNSSKKIIYEKNKAVQTKFKKISNNFQENNKNIIEIKIKKENGNTNYNTNNKERIHTLNNNNDAKNIFSKKIKIDKKKTSNLNLNMTNSNLFSTDRKSQYLNINNINNKIDSNSNIAYDDKERKTLYAPNCEFNLTWSKFPLKAMQTQFNLPSDKSYINNPKNNMQNIIRNSTNINDNVHKNLNKKIFSQFKKKNKSIINSNSNKFSTKNKKDTTPQKIVINRKKMNNSKTNNSSMKNINYINYTKPKMKDEFYMNIKDNIDNVFNSYENDNKILIKTQNQFYPAKGDIYVRKKGSKVFGGDIKTNQNLEKIEDENNYKYEIIQI